MGNNLKVFFIRDAMKFADLVHAFSPWGIPASYRHMEGSGVNTYKWVNAKGESFLVKYHWVPRQGVKNLLQSQAEELQAKNFNHATQDLYEAIARGEHPEWEFCGQQPPGKR